MIKIRLLPTAIAIAFSLLSVPPIAAKSIDQDPLLKSVDLVRERLIVRGIWAYQAGYYTEAVTLLRDFLSDRRIIATLLEKQGLIYLALAYQRVGESNQATKTIERGINLAHNSPLELAQLEDAAGSIAQEQNQLQRASIHWEKARQLYLACNQRQQWTEVTLKLAHNYRRLQKNRKYQELLAELSS
ncbi:MAG: hypothetical protein AAGE84_25880 [Cyanobacteria bacterium P01_G01_bin.39]